MLSLLVIGTECMQIYVSVLFFAVKYDIIMMIIDLFCVVSSHFLCLLLLLYLAKVGAVVLGGAACLKNVQPPASLHAGRAATSCM